MKIQSINSNVTFEKNTIIRPEVIESLNNSRLGSETATRLLGHITKTIKEIEGDGFYLFNSANVSRDKKRLTLIGKFATNKFVDNVSFTIRTRDAEEEVQKSVKKYIKNFKPTIIES